MRGVLSVLFGASILLITEEQNDQSINAADRYFRRMMWLLAICLITSYIFLAQTSILYEYAIDGMLLFVFRKLNYKWLMSLGIICLILYSFIMGSNFFHYKSIRDSYNVAIGHVKSGATPTEEDKEAIQAWKDTRVDWINGMKNIKEEIAGYRELSDGGYLSVLIKMQN